MRQYFLKTLLFSRILWDLKTQSKFLNSLEPSWFSAGSLCLIIVLCVCARTCACRCAKNAKVVSR